MTDAVDAFEAERGLVGRSGAVAPPRRAAPRAEKSFTRGGPRPPPCEALVLDAIALGECLVPWYLICGYAYEALDETLVHDATWDRLCKALDAEWGEQDHRHLAVVDREALASATASYLKEDVVPSMAKSCARRWAYDGWPKKK